MKKNRLSKKEINTLYKTGKKISFSSFYLFWDFNKQLNNSGFRIVISVPKKKINRAVDRNYIKRCIKEIYLKSKTNLSTKIIMPVDIILIYNKSHIIEFKQLQEELLTLLQKITTKVNENY